MIQALDALKIFCRAGYEFYAGVPCSYLTPLIDAVIGSRELLYVGAANEGDAVALAAGAELGGRRAVVLFQNSGLGNAVNPLTSLTYTFRLPVLIITTWRGEPGGAKDEPQHELMGQITPNMLDLMQIPWELFPNEAPTLEAALGRARAHMDQAGRPYALILQKGSVAAAPSAAAQPLEQVRPECTPRGVFGPNRLSQDEALQAIIAGSKARDVLLTTTGYCGRALYAIEDRPQHLYMVGSMGCASSLGLGLALVRPTERVIVIDGDGALLMRLGALATIGHERPKNFLHVLLDNAVHDSTGSQATVSPTVDLALTASAAGYTEVERCGNRNDLMESVRRTSPGPRFVHVRTAPRKDHALPRPTMTPPQVAERLRHWLASSPPRP